MIRSLQLVFVLCLLLSAVATVGAQDSPTDFTFPSGIQFDVPADMTLDLSNPAIPAVRRGETILIQMVDPDLMVNPEIIANAPDTTLNLPLTDAMDVLLPAVGYATERGDDDTVAVTLADEREVIVYEFTNMESLPQIMIVLPFSDGRVGALNVQSVSQLTEDERITVMELAQSFDVNPDAEAAPAGTEYAYESGVSFRYPDHYDIADLDNPPVSIGIPDVIIIRMVDPTFVGMPTGEPMDAIINFVSGLLEIDAETFEPFDIGTREAVVSVTEQESLVQTIVIVRFDNGTAGIMVVVTTEPLQGERLEEVQSVAASFNSGSAEVAALDDAELARERYLEGQAAHEAGEFEEAISLYTEAIALDDSLTIAYFRRAMANRSSGNLEDALADFQHVLELEPAEVHIHASTAHVYALIDDMDSALAEMEAFIEKAGLDALNAEDQEAYDYYSRVVDGEYVPEFYTARAARLRAIERYEEAIRDLELAIENEPDRAILYAQLGLNYMAMEQVDEAINIYNDGIRIQPLRVLFFNRGHAYQALMPGNLDTMINMAHSFQCVLLLDDDGTLGEDHLAQANRILTVTLIDSDDYEPITDPADCAA